MLKAALYRPVWLLLDRYHYNATAAARALGTTRETLRYRIEKYGLKPPG